MERVLSRLRKLDAYPKINDDFYSRTLSGGLLTLLSSLIILFLFLSEFRQFPHSPPSLPPLSLFVSDPVLIFLAS
ncbi:hypothetical protein MLD38_026740 [Melastoma candidum]|uniref:Uncharacterized protein n=1 Tax=Melastoma candidum TaxID=119954 RepID=A0ACB9P0L0_9MYRT|nr:hypothetical protein MLD38_026740 [Melastoma candidum]